VSRSIPPRLPPSGPAATVVSAFPAGRDSDAAALVFEYMAATLAATGRPAPGDVTQLPEVLQREYRDLREVYRPPGTLLIADREGHPVGCVGLAARHPDGTAEVTRLYVRPGARGAGIARVLMRDAHHHAAEHGMTRLILDVLPARTAVIGFYQRLGYTETAPYPTGSPVPMIYLERPVTADDIIPAPGLA
jgi:ribosomal protein S18 acetylase RimI-like enzyme